MNEEQKSCPYRLKSCVWEITLACCFTCKYCGSKAGRARENELTTAECLDVATQLADLGCRRVSLIGGEVFMRPDWAEIIKALTEKDIRVCVITNGFLLSQKHLSLLKELRVESVAVSLDGPEQIHDFFRQEGSFQRAIHTIEALHKNRIPVSVISTLHSENVNYLEVMADILRDTGIFAWQLQACSPMGNAGNGGFRTEIDFNTIIHFVESHIDKLGFAVGIADNIGYFTESEGYLRGSLSGQGFFHGCAAGLEAIGIDSIGNVRGCESMYDARFIEGNLREKSLAEIWTAADSFAYNRQFRPELLTGKCGTCTYGKYCAGGCRSYNYFTHGKLYESLRCVCEKNGFSL